MRKWPIYGLLLIAALLVPTRTTELGKLKPVETVAIYQEGDQLVIETDTGDVGRGSSVNMAIENLRETTAGTIYLDTANYLIVMEGGTLFIKYLSPYLKDSIRICMGDKNIDLEEAGTYLSVHRPSLKLKDYQSGSNLDVLISHNERLELRKK